jgi:hypothetical protein
LTINLISLFPLEMPNYSYKRPHIALLRKPVFVLLSSIAWINIFSSSCFAEGKADQEIPAYYGSTTANDVRLRETPSVNGKIVKSLPKDTRFIVDAKVSTNDAKYKEWFHVDLESKSGYSVRGYIFSGFVQKRKVSGLIQSKDGKAKIEFQDELVNVINSQNNKLIKSFKLSRQLDEESVIIENAYPYLMLRLTPMRWDEPEKLVTGILNVENGEWIPLDNYDTFICSGIFLSPSGKYLAIDSGTSAVRGLTILDLPSKKIIHKTDYYGRVKWLPDDTLQIYQGMDDEPECEGIEYSTTSEWPWLKRLVQWKGIGEKIIKKCIPADSD